jgi:hypothetical protein
VDFTVKVPRLVGLLLVAVGAALAAGGPEGLARVGAAVWTRLDLLLVGLAVAAFVTAVAPRGTLILPLALALAGGALHLMRTGSWSSDALSRLSGALAIVMGGWVVMADTPDARADPVDPVLRRAAVLFPRHVRVGRQAPAQVVVLAVGTRLLVDFTGSTMAKFNATELVVSCWAARVEVAVPHAWPVVGGRLRAAHRIRFTGQLDSEQLAPSPQDRDTAGWLGELSRERARRATGDEPAESFAVVVHVLGLGGEVVLVGR